MTAMKRIDPDNPHELLTAAQVHERFGLPSDVLLRWIKLRRVRPVHVRLARGEVGSPLRFPAGDIAAAVEASSLEQTPRRHDPMMG
jgi:hypothetical protein